MDPTGLAVSWYLFYLAKDPLVLPVIRGMRPMVSELLKPDPRACVQKRSVNSCAVRQPGSESGDSSQAALTVLAGVLNKIVLTGAAAAHLAHQVLTDLRALFPGRARTPSLAAGVWLRNGESLTRLLRTAWIWPSQVWSQQKLISRSSRCHGWKHCQQAGSFVWSLRVWTLIRTLPKQLVSIMKG